MQLQPRHFIHVHPALEAHMPRAHDTLMYMRCVQPWSWNHMNKYSKNNLKYRLESAHRPLVNGSQGVQALNCYEDLSFKSLPK